MAYFPAQVQAFDGLSDVGREQTRVWNAIRRYTPILGEGFSLSGDSRHLNLRRRKRPDSRACSGVARGWQSGTRASALPCCITLALKKGARVPPPVECARRGPPADVHLRTRVGRVRPGVRVTPRLSAIVSQQQRQFVRSVRPRNNTRTTEHDAGLRTAVNTSFSGFVFICLMCRIVPSACIL